MDCEGPQLEAVERAHSQMDTLIEDSLTLAREGEGVTETKAVDKLPSVRATPVRVRSRTDPGSNHHHHMSPVCPTIQIRIPPQSLGDNSQQTTGHRR